MNKYVCQIGSLKILPSQSLRVAFFKARRFVHDTVDGSEIRLNS